MIVQMLSSVKVENVIVPNVNAMMQMIKRMSYIRE